ncbi:MAG: hypothetical protein KBD31_05910 [Proteobacteria bacterium]|nr:hypothetical protein [Pseudomonadota bacterium]
MADRKKKGKGWFLSCQYCFHEWWQTSPKGFSWYDGGEQTISYGKTVAPSPLRFHDHTNLDALKYRELTEAEKKALYHQQVMENSYSPFYDHPSFNESDKGLTILEEKIKTSFVYKAFIVFLMCLLILSIAVFFNFIKIENTVPFVQNLMQNNVPANQKLILGLQINDVKYEVQHCDDGQNIIVSGTVLNPSTTEEKLTPLKISIWGNCKTKTIASSLSSGEPYCLIKSWEYTFKEATIKENGILSFETTGTIDRDEHPLKVDVTF